MARRAPRLCTWPRCPEIVKHGDRCDKHKARARPAPHPATTSERGYDATWQRLREMVLRRHPICEHCRRVKASEVHHVVPIRVDPRMRLDPENLTAVCHACHVRAERRLQDLEEGRTRQIDPLTGLELDDDHA